VMMVSVSVDSNNRKPIVRWRAYDLAAEISSRSFPYSPSGLSSSRLFKNSLESRLKVFRPLPELENTRTKQWRRLGQWLSASRQVCQNIVDSNARSFEILSENDSARLRHIDPIVFDRQANTTLLDIIRKGR
jgi:hypothetical protein